MGLHSTTNQPEKITAAKAIRLNASCRGGGGKAAAFKWSLYAKKHQAKHLQEMKEEEEQNNKAESSITTADVLPPTLTRRASTVSLVSNQDLITTSLQEPIEEFPLDAIPQVITLSATQVIDPISLLMNDNNSSQEELHPTLDDLKSLLPASTIPDEDSTACSNNNAAAGSTNTDLVGWTATVITWIE